MGDYIIDRPEQGVFTVDRDVFRDPRIFDLEMAAPKLEAYDVVLG